MCFLDKILNYCNRLRWGGVTRVDNAVRYGILLDMRDEINEELKKIRKELKKRESKKED